MPFSCNNWHLPLLISIQDGSCDSIWSYYGFLLFMFDGLDRFLLRANCDNACWQPVGLSLSSKALWGSGWSQQMLFDHPVFNHITCHCCCSSTSVASSFIDLLQLRECCWLSLTGLPRQIQCTAMQKADACVCGCVSLSRWVRQYVVTPQCIIDWHQERWSNSIIWTACHTPAELLP